MTNAEPDRERIEFWSTALQSDLFEEVFASLEEILATLEGGNLTLADTIALYELGVRLNRRCQDILDDASLRIEEIDATVARKPDRTEASEVFRIGAFAPEVPF